MSEVNQRNMALWIVALRSGKYRQAKGALRADDGYCCLGVECEISGLGKWELDEFAWRYKVSASEWSANVLPDGVVETLFNADEILTHNPTLGTEPDGTVINCAYANDQLGWSFNQIADALESRYLPNTTAAAVLSQTEEGK